MTTRDANPFEVLRLDPTTPAEEIVGAAALLRQRATDETDIAALRRAVQALTGSPRERRLHELLTHASPCYYWRAVEEFAAKHWRSPRPQSEPSADVETDDLPLDAGD